LEDLGVDWRIILKSGLKEIGWGIVAWIHLAQDRDKWWVLVITVLNLQVP
jgi:hypothetical protein